MVKERGVYHPVNGPRTHANCREQTGVQRPGKTAKDKAMGVNRVVPNKRVWDDKAQVFVKV